jgi:hypothetical protein
MVRRRRGISTEFRSRGIGIWHRSAPGTGLVRKTSSVHSTFTIVIWVVCVLAVVIALGLLVVTGKTWEDFGKGRFSMDREPGPGPAPASAAGIAEREYEIRQLLEARNARRARRGQAPIDVEQELARLTEPKGPSVDPALREEIRQLVVARNHRRVRAGRPPLDLEAEIEREIAGLDEL